MSDNLRMVAYKVETALLEIAELCEAGPHIRISHRFRQAGVVGCLPGEEAVAAFVVSHGRTCQLRLSLSGRLLLDYLARHRHSAQSAVQISAGISADEFYRKHAANAGGSAKMLRRIPRSSIRVHIARLRKALALTFQEIGIRLDVGRVIVSQPTVSNEVGYVLKAVVEWSHEAG